MFGIFKKKQQTPRPEFCVRLGQEIWQANMMEKEIERFVSEGRCSRISVKNWDITYHLNTRGFEKQLDEGSLEYSVPMDELLALIGRTLDQHTRHALKALGQEPNVACVPAGMTFLADPFIGEGVQKPSSTARVLPIGSAKPFRSPQGDGEGALYLIPGHLMVIPSVELILHNWVELNMDTGYPYRSAKKIAPIPPSVSVMGSRYSCLTTDDEAQHKSISLPGFTAKVFSSMRAVYDEVGFMGGLNGKVAVRKRDNILTIAAENEGRLVVYSQLTADTIPVTRNHLSPEANRALELFETRIHPGLTEFNFSGMRVVWYMAPLPVMRHDDRY